MTRLLAGAALAILIAGGARRARALSSSGAIAAVLMGTACIAAGWHWGALLVAYFVASSLLSRWREDAKSRRTSSIVAKGGERDATQVLANGGIYAAAAVASLVHPHAVIDALGLGALAAATADTWGTEIGTLARGTPRLLTTWRAVPAGTSGAVSAPGTIATFAGAGFIAALALALGWAPRPVAAGALGGIVGAMADSLLGATLQARRWCDTCASPTEREVHRCGARSRHAGGLAWLDNDRVNLACAAVGGIVAAAATAATS